MLGFPPPPPGFRNMLYWRALVESRPPNVRKLRGRHFFGQPKTFCQKLFVWKKVIFWNFQDFSRFFFSGSSWIWELWSNCVVLKLRNKEYFFSKTFFCWKKVIFCSFSWFLDFLTTSKTFRTFWVFYGVMDLFSFLFFNNYYFFFGFEKIRFLD